MRPVLENCSKRLAYAARWLAIFGLLGCGAHKNYDERRAEANEQQARDVDLGAKRADPCIHRCDADPVPAPVNCDEAERGLQFLDPPIWDFSSRTPYSYDDGSTGNGGLVLQETVPDALVPNVQRCADRAVDTVYRVWGGPYMAWGGGIGTSVLDFNVSLRGIRDCSNGGGSPNCTSPEEWVAVRTLDASAWDGISFWARRGPESQAGIRVALGDKYTDDDLNVDAHPPEPNFTPTDRVNLRLGSDDGIDVEQALCKRTRQCSCDGNRPCTRNPNNNLHYCYDPSYESPPTDDDDLCGEDACNAQYATQRFSDPTFHGRSCTPYVFRSGRSGSYCFNPGQDPNPAEGYETCGDHYTKGVNLSGNWQFFTIPFGDLRQQGYGKESPGLLTDQISIVRFTWGAGFIDYTLDDVRFYRVQR